MLFMNFITKNKKNKEHFYEGCYSTKDILAPSYINLKNPKYIEIDGNYYSGIIISNYYRNYNDLILKKLMDTNCNINISIFYEKQDTYKTIRDLTYHIGNVSADLKTKNENRQDMDIASYTYNDAKYIRKEIQLNNEDLYFLYIYICVYAKDLKELNYLLNKIEGICQSNGMQTKKGIFRQEQIFNTCLPYMNNSEDLKPTAKRNILTSSLISTYPFLSSSIFEDNGILIGTNIYDNSLIFINRFEKEKYKNANMCVFGTSGAGKSYYIKVLILRNAIMGLSQYIVDPDREYSNMCKKLGGSIIKLGPTSKTYINVFDIREESVEEAEGYLSNKIAKLIGFFKLVFTTYNDEEMAILEDKIIQCYYQKEITFDDKSLYDKKTKKFKTSKQMPILQDLYNLLERDERTQKMKTRLIPFIKGSLKFLNNYTNVELNNKLIVADVYELGEENLKYGMYIFTELFWDKIKKDRKENKAIYLDEIWRLIGVTSNKEVASFIYKIFKTIRKYGGSAVAITQDVEDLFSLENGVYGKSILNNSNIKNIFSLEEENILILQKYSNLTEKEKIEIKSLKRGECLMFVGENHLLVKIESAKFEQEIIND